jgi:hypothetical protein
VMLEHYIRRIRFHYHLIKSLDSSVGIATGLRAGRSVFGGSIPGGGWEFFSSPPLSERLWGPSVLLCDCYRWFFLWG